MEVPQIILKQATSVNVCTLSALETLKTDYVSFISFYLCPHWNLIYLHDLQVTEPVILNVKLKK